MNTIYGVDNSKAFSAKDVCNAIVECFTEAHREVLDEMIEFSDGATKEEFERMKVINVKQMLSNFFREIGGDCDNPTKEELLLVLDKLKNFSSNFRNQKVINMHYNKLMKLVEKL